MIVDTHFVFFFKQKTAYEMRISDWSSDVCSSDLLAAGVIAGVVLSGLFFASKVRRMFTVDSTLSADHRTRAYRITGEIFFASAERFADAFDFKEVLDHVVIEIGRAHV